MHQLISISKHDGIIENIEADHSYFFAYVNYIDKNNFDKRFLNIWPCTPVGTRLSFQGDVYYSIKLHPTHRFMWENETIGGHNRWSD